MENTGKSFYAAEPVVGGPIEPAQIKKGDRIRKEAINPEQTVQVVEYIAEWDSDPRGFQGLYTFTLLKREDAPWKKYPTRIGAMIKVDGFVPAVLTHMGWQHIGKYAKLGRYNTAQELYERAAAQGRAGFEVLYAGYEEKA